MCEVFKQNLMEPGGFADLMLIRERAVALAARTVPDTLSDERAVFLEPAACVLRGIDRFGNWRLAARLPCSAPAAWGCCICWCSAPCFPISR